MSRTLDLPLEDTALRMMSIGRGMLALEQIGGVMIQRVSEMSTLTPPDCYKPGWRVETVDMTVEHEDIATALGLITRTTST